jgi:sugar phosphate isomerase/epimerase
MTDRPFGWRRRQLVYCSNVHPGATLEQVRRVIGQHLPAVRERRSLDRLGSGLWLSAPVARQLLTEHASLHAFADLLQANGIELLTLNGFPHDDFHQPQVKARVYQPDWSERARLDYTLDLAQILAHCLPQEQEEGTISTLPLGFGPDWSDEKQTLAITNIVELVHGLAAIRERSGRRIRVCLEMEPGCVLEQTDQLIDFFIQELAGLPASLMQDHLGVCYDVCHQAVMFEQPGEGLTRIAAAGIPIGKIQISNALQADRPATTAQRNALEQFAEPRYLHQVRSRAADGAVSGVMDLPQALAGRLPDDQPWRIHFHVPIQSDGSFDGTLGTTRTAILQVLDWLARNRQQRPHLEVETYSWQALPPALRPDNDTALQRGITAELAWLEQALEQRDLILEESS